MASIALAQSGVDTTWAENTRRCHPICVDHFNGPELLGHAIYFMNGGEDIGKIIVGYHPDSGEPRVLCVGYTFEDTEPANLENDLAAACEIAAIAAHYNVPEWVEKVNLMNDAISQYDKNWVQTYMADVRARDAEVFERLDSLSGNDRLGCVRLVIKVLEAKLANQA
jgi:hypothetical protein